MQIGFLSKAIRAYRDGRVGDAAAYKAVALGTPAYPAVERALARLADPCPRIELELLRALPAGTFGHACAHFLDARGLRPLLVSPPLAAELARTNALAVRYPVLHDAFHVLLDFDTSLSGELGVWSFVAAQHYSPAFERAAAFARRLYPLLAPTKLAELRSARARAERMAHEAPCLIAEPLEQFWAEPLAALRARLRLQVAAEA